MSTAERLDILIVGAGLSGIGTAHHLKSAHPDRSFAILESRPQIGGTWDLFRYPGIRSDSDMHTLGFDFEPWRHEKSIADAPAILDYLHRIVDEGALPGGDLAAPRAVLRGRDGLLDQGTAQPRDGERDLRGAHQPAERVDPTETTNRL